MVTSNIRLAIKIDTGSKIRKIAKFPLNPFLIHNVKTNLQLIQHRIISKTPKREILKTSNILTFPKA